VNDKKSPCLEYKFMKKNTSAVFHSCRLIFYAILLIWFCLDLSFLLAGQKTRQQKIIPLPELEAAYQVRAESGRVYVQDKKDIAVFSFATGKFLRRIGGQGQGPGEFSLLGHFRLVGNRLFAADILKILIFSAEGDYLGQLLPPSRIMRYPYLPVGNNFVGVPLERKEDGTLLPPELVSYNQAGKPLKRVLQVPDVLPPPPPPPGASLPSSPQESLMIREYFDYLVFDNKVFVADSTKGLSISVFDEKGNLLYEIRHPVEKLKVSREDRGSIIKNMSEEFLKNFRPVFPDYFSSFVAFKIDGGKIYVVTPARKNNFNEVIVMDMKGKIIERSFCFPKKVDYFVPNSWAQTFDVEQGRFVWVEYNEATEQHELHIY